MPKAVLRLLLSSRAIVQDSRAAHQALPADQQPDEKRQMLMGIPAETTEKRVLEGGILAVCRMAH
jgi:hypothetical protein